MGLVYEHYKGNRYRIITLALDEKTHEDVVVYCSVADESQVWTRPVAQFFGTVPPGVERRFKPVLP